MCCNQIAKALRVSAEVLYIRAGILEPSETSEVRDAIITDTAITERQKQVLLDIYTSFCQQNEGLQNADLQIEAAGARPTRSRRLNQHSNSSSSKPNPQYRSTNPEVKGNNNG